MSPRTPLRPPGMVLVIDDEQDLAENLQEVLHEHGIEACCAASRAEGLRALQREGVRVVVTDMRLREDSGLDVIAAMKARWPQIPVVVITAYARDDALEQAREAGAITVLPKPVDVDRFARLMRTLSGTTSHILVLAPDPGVRNCLTEAIAEHAGRIPHPAATDGDARAILAHTAVDAVVIGPGAAAGDPGGLRGTLQRLAPQARLIWCGPEPTAPPPAPDLTLPLAATGCPRSVAKVLTPLLP